MTYKVAGTKRNPYTSELYTDLVPPMLRYRRRVFSAGIVRPRLLSVDVLIMSDK